ncbi:MAG TPA: 2-aminoethylphosphonate--pyruvate transaminase [Candidatus Acidoferrum sp.]|nr:2-aminoethylphosphonate--pyruvate transaminase [Candidatus Acidoferrum sp.]
MDITAIPDNPYRLLTPGPLSTTKSVKAAMLRDWCTWDQDYNAIVQELRGKLVSLATKTRGYTAVLMQGSGTFCVEATIGTALPEDGTLLVLANGAYGARIRDIARRLRIRVVVNDSEEVKPPSIELLEKTLASNPNITHVAVVHCETTTGMLNPVEAIGGVVKSFGKIFIVDAMSSFGGIPLDAADLGADFLISSANKCIQGVPGFGFIIARRDELERTKDRARSLSLDLYDQWREMEDKQGKWRFTSPTHVVRAFAQAMTELEQEGGVEARYARYRENHRTLVEGMRRLGFKCLLLDQDQSPIITSFLSPEHSLYTFERFYLALKARGFVIYPGKVTSADTFRIGNIGDLCPEDMRRLVDAVKDCMFWDRSSSDRGPARSSAMV